MPASSDIRIASSTGAYDVHIAPGSFPGLLSAQPDDVIIADAYFAGALASRGERLITLEAVEGNKTRISIAWEPYQSNADEIAVFTAGHASMAQGCNASFEQLDAYLTQLPRT